MPYDDVFDSSAGLYKSWPVQTKLCKIVPAILSTDLQHTVEEVAAVAAADQRRAQVCQDILPHSFPGGPPGVAGPALTAGNSPAPAGYIVQ